MGLRGEEKWGKMGKIGGKWGGQTGKGIFPLLFLHCSPSYARFPLFPIRYPPFSPFSTGFPYFAPISPHFSWFPSFVGEQYGEP